MLFATHGINEAPTFLKDESQRTSSYFNLPPTATPRQTSIANHNPHIRSPVCHWDCCFHCFPSFVRWWRSLGMTCSYRRPPGITIHFNTHMVGLDGQFTFMAYITACMVENWEMQLDGMVTQFWNPWSEHAEALKWWHNIVYEKGGRKKIKTRSKWENWKYFSCIWCHDSSYHVQNNVWLQKSRQRPRTLSDPDWFKPSSHKRFCWGRNACCNPSWVKSSRTGLEVYTYTMPPS